MKKTIAYNGILKPEEYLKIILERDVNIEKNNQTEQIENLLDDKFGEGSYWSYRFDEIEHVIENGLTVVAVEVNETKKTHYRWFEISENIDVEKEMNKIWMK